MINICDRPAQGIVHRSEKSNSLSLDKKIGRSQLSFLIQRVSSCVELSEVPGDSSSADTTTPQGQTQYLPSQESSATTAAPGAKLMQPAVPSVDGEAGSAVQHLSMHQINLDEIREVHVAFTAVLATIRESEPDSQEKIQAHADVVRYAGNILQASAHADGGTATASAIEPHTAEMSAQAEAEHEPHEAGGGGLAIDLDEAVHGLYTALIYTIQAAHGNADDIYQSFVDNAALLSDSPFEWLRDGAAPHGTLDFGLGVGVAAFLLPFAYLAIKAGIEETHGAQEHQGKLQQASEAAEQRISILADLERMLKHSPLLSRGEQAAPLKKIIEMAEARLLLEQYGLDLLRFAQKQNAGAHAVGIASMTSGGAIGTQAALALLSKSLAFTGNPASPGVLGVAGVLGALLMPVAAAGATGLGIGMVLGSQAGKKIFLQDRQIMAAHWQELEQALESRGGRTGGAARDDFINEYQAFLATKSAQRERFWKVFHALNGVFLSGSAIYSSGAILKTGLVATASVAALTGTVSFPPALIIAATALIAGGGVTMLAGSGQFLNGHGKQHRYGDYRVMDDRQLDRNFLSVLELLPLLQPEMDPLIGVRQRARFLQQQEKKDDLRQDFLCRIGQDQSMRYDGVTTHSTDDDVTRVKRRQQKLVAGKTAATRFFSRAGFTAKNKKAEMKSAGTFVKHSIRALGSASNLKNSYRDAKQASQDQYQLSQALARAAYASAKEQGQRARILGAARLGLQRSAAMLALPLRVSGATAANVFRNPVLAAQQLYARKTDHLTLASVDGWISRPENRARLCSFLREVLTQKQSYLQQKVALKSRLYAIDEDNPALEERASALGRWLQEPPEEHALAGQVKNFLEDLQRDQAKDKQMLEEIATLRQQLKTPQPGVSYSAGMHHEAEFARMIDRFLDCEQESLSAPGRVRPGGSATMRLATYLMEEAPQRYRDHRGILLETEMQSAGMHRMVQKTFAAGPKSSAA